MAFALAEACIRPYSTNILLSQQEHDTGAAASLINFAHTAVGSVGMLVAVMPWPNFVVGIGVIIVATMAAAGGIWWALLRSSIPLVGIKQHPATAGSSAEAGELEAAAAGASEQVPEQPA